MTRAGLQRAFAIGVIVVTTYVPAAGVRAQTPGEGRNAVHAAPAAASVGSITGAAWKTDTTPYALARLRLRNVDTGRGVARAQADTDGVFRFANIDPGPYVVELVTEHDRVLAISDLLAVSPGRDVATVVRLSAKAPWYGGFFGNAAAAVISAASTLGVTARGSNGQPASAQ
jgi:hypothetical protein